MRLKIFAALLLAAAGLLFLLYRDGARRPPPTQTDQAQTLTTTFAGDGGTLVWLKSAGGERKLLMRLSRNETIRNLHWSPDRRFAAFESYDTAGHSPMTTTHVWVVETKSAGLRKVLLPEPNERFSTYLEEWTDAGTLRIRTTLLDRAEDVHFTYRLSTGRVEGPVG